MRDQSMGAMLATIIRNRLHHREEARTWRESLRRLSSHPLSRTSLSLLCSKIYWIYYDAFSDLYVAAIGDHIDCVDLFTGNHFVFSPEHWSFLLVLLFVPVLPSRPPGLLSGGTGIIGQVISLKTCTLYTFGPVLSTPVSNIYEPSLHPHFHA
jgi:hypothetical protein